MRFINLLTFLSLFIWNDVDAQCYQDATGDKKLAKEYLNYEMYNCALKELKILHQKKPKKMKYTEQIVECIMNIEDDKSRAIPYLEKIIQQKLFSDEYLLWLGQAYFHAERFEEAIDMLNRFLGTGPNNSLTSIAQDYVLYAENAKELTKFPVNVTFENLGEDVNSEWSEYVPYVAPEEDYIIFSSNRERTMGNYPFRNGYVSDLCIAQLRGGDYVRSRPMGGTYNTIDIDEVAGGSADGMVLFIATDADFQIFNLKISQKGPRSRSFPRPEYLEDINGSNSNEISATINDKGDLIIFSSDREGGYGGQDLWMAKMLPDGSWGIPINLGPQINTAKDEVFPMFTPDQKTITFSSNGHFTMGGLDLFETTFSEELKTWTAPKNLAYPINTTYDDYNIIYTANGRNAYKSAWRKDTYGMRDLYRITFLDTMPNYTVVNSKIVSNDTLLGAEFNKDSLLTKVELELARYQKMNKKDKKTKAVLDSLKAQYIALENERINSSPFAAEINVFKENSDELYGTYKPNLQTGKFVMLLDPGKYNIQIKHKKYANTESEITIYGKGDFTPLLDREFTLRE